MATVADRIAEWLHEKGITHAFGIVGGGNVALWDAITRLKKTQIVCVHHEQAAAMAAAYYFRVSGRMALALVTTGAGSTNPVTGVMAAWMDRVPLLVISGNEASKYFDIAKYGEPRVSGVQGFYSPLVVDSMTKFSTQMLPWANACGLLEMAWQAVMQSPQGPAWVDIPKDLQSARV